MGFLFKSLSGLGEYLGQPGYLLMTRRKGKKLDFLVVITAGLGEPIKRKSRKSKSRNLIGSNGGFSIFSINQVSYLILIFPIYFIVVAD